MLELVLFMLGCVFTLIVIAIVAVHKEDQERYNMVQKRNNIRSDSNGTV